MSDGKFYLGRIVDAATGDTTADKLLYDPDDLTTHGVVVGMTGSGKTGLCVDLLEEAALNNLPAIMIDPKGDITNTLLHFPELLPSDFKPWVNADDARRAGKTVVQAAADTADLWKNGLAKWDIGSDRLNQLKNSVERAVYTPGSDAGLSISILASLSAPKIDWNSNKEILREKISGTVTAILGLVGLKNIDPVRSREHILLSNIFETAWSKGQDLTLAELIMQTQNPPFEKLGVFDIEQFFPNKDRFKLAMDLNNILASPAFQSWVEGQPLDIENILYTPDGKARHSVFYIAHLNDDERMFFVTLLFSAIESWMRTQAGTTSLRALVYFDEIFGYLPPTGNPPSKEPMLRMLKQARAFGVGMVLATQNPVDIDYKALSNAGTWFIGKLGTEQDKARLLDGLSTALGGGIDRKQYDDMLSSLGKRVFLMRNVHDKQPSLFGTRWAMNYLAGPMTRTQIPELNALVGASEQAQAEVVTMESASPAQTSAAAIPTATAKPTPRPQLEGSQTRPAVPTGFDEFFLPANVTVGGAAQLRGYDIPSNTRELGIIYRPILLAQLDILFNNRKYDINTTVKRAALVQEPDRRGTVRWEEFELASGLNPDQFDRVPLNNSRYASLESPLSDSKTLKSLRTDLIDWGYRGTQLTLRANTKLKVYAGPEVDLETFEQMCEDAAAPELEAELNKTVASFDKKTTALEKKLRKEERELEMDREDLSSRKREEAVRHISTVAGLLGFGGRSRRASGLSSSMTKRRMTSKAKQDVLESEDAIEEMKQEIASLDDQEREALAAVQEKWEDIIDEIEEEAISPYKKDVMAELFGVAWLPYYIVDMDGRNMEFPAFSTEFPM